LTNKITYVNIALFRKLNSQQGGDRVSKKPKFDYSNLLSELKRLGITQEEFASGIGTNPSTLSIKLNNKGYFKQIEMDKACQVLNIPNSDIGAYFFVPKV
jgi:hypothetical protein